ncbi:P-loop containing nucleoside triphosphate hydrolase protein [Sordaria brevicollis]|uniref:P-loop containing nucleoside triphosphate hydrolase protein n=1 Tax=Sordaria brevicollis TaxID=83679 RepID=A0AAE0PJ47_SORBR|nr:P-loop containing nucleoside triphosphate hydrolase protein [Sordaria brevicollis]
MSSFTVPSKKSRALAIVNPETGEATNPTPQPNPSTLTDIPSQSTKGKFKDGPPTKKSAKATAKARASLWVPPPQGSTFDADEHFARGYDVYAAPFVPSALKDINQYPGMFFDTSGKHVTNYAAYTSAILPTSLLPVVPEQQAGYSPNETSHLMPQCYDKYFRNWVELEQCDQKTENASYALYAHTGMVSFTSPHEATVTMTVPGLRENTPHVEVDDQVQLRQLRFDYPGHLNVHPWTGYIYNARVEAVVRATETLVLRVTGLTYQTAQFMAPSMMYPLPTEFEVKFNVQFCVPMERSQPMIDVLPLIQESLDLAAQMTKEEIDSIDDITGTGSNRPKSRTLSPVNVYWIQSMLFPTEADCSSQTNMVNWLEHYNGARFDESLNYEQRIAVDSVLCQNYGTMPYLISGPPGTGKTKTMIEIALQLVCTNNVPNCSHILVCAPSEPAADTLADRLSKCMGRDELLRLNRPTRDSREVPSNLLPYCYMQNDVFCLPPFSQLMSYKIIVTSCRDASMLLYARLTNSDLHAVSSGLHQQIHPTLPPPKSVPLHWGALLIDEAAQAMEPEALIPLQVVAPPLRCPSDPAFVPLVIMAGDEQQLNPRTSSPNSPLQQSLFARLFERPVYANHPLSRRFRRTQKGQTAEAPKQQYQLHPSLLPILRPPFTNLIRNYRSHPAILAMPSKLFYFDTLLPAADFTDRNRLSQWSGWRSPNHWPILYHDNPSPDDLDLPSPDTSTISGGWYNVGEAHLACSYALDLWRSGLVKQKEICIMSPFKAQVRLIRRLIRGAEYNGGKGLWEVNVGPTEAFQGLEFGVVVLCVTRSRRRWVGRDRVGGWGVLPGPTRDGRAGGQGGQGGRGTGRVGGGIRNKLNVALTRAKFGLIILGSREVMMPDSLSSSPSSSPSSHSSRSSPTNSSDESFESSQDGNSHMSGSKKGKQGEKMETKKGKQNMEIEENDTKEEEEEEGTEWAQIIDFCERNGCVADSNPPPPLVRRRRRWGLTRWEVEQGVPQGGVGHLGNSISNFDVNGGGSSGDIPAKEDSHRLSSGGGASGLVTNGLVTNGQVNGQVNGIASDRGNGSGSSSGAAATSTTGNHTAKATKKPTQKTTENPTTKPTKKRTGNPTGSAGVGENSVIATAIAAAAAGAVAVANSLGVGGGGGGSVGAGAGGSAGAGAGAAASGRGSAGGAAATAGAIGVTTGGPGNGWPEDSWSDDDDDGF